MSESGNSAPVIDVSLERGAIDLSVALRRRESLRPPGCGAEAVFVGRVRPEFRTDLGELEAIEYEAYTSMAERIMREVGDQAAAEHACGAVLIRHSVGRVHVGEASVEVVVMAAHRGQAFEACRAVMDGLKRSAPIWKRVVFSHGGAWQGAPDAGAAKR